MIKDRPSWANRPAIVFAVAFIIGAIVAGVAVAFVLTHNDNKSTSSVQANSTPGAATGTPTVAGTSTPSVSPTPLNPRKPDDALASYVQGQMKQTYMGPCPQQRAGQTAQGICSIELYRSDKLVTFTIGPPFSGAVGEAVLQPAENGVWTVDFVGRTNRPPAAGAKAAVYGAGDCLNIHSGPSKAAQALTCPIDGTKADVVGGPQSADGVTWWQLKDLGWASQEFLETAP